MTEPANDRIITALVTEARDLESALDAAVAAADWAMARRLNTEVARWSAALPAVGDGAIADGAAQLQAAAVRLQAAHARAAATVTAARDDVLASLTALAAGQRGVAAYEAQR